MQMEPAKAFPTAQLPKLKNNPEQEVPANKPKGKKKFSAGAYERARRSHFGMGKKNA